MRHKEGTPASVQRLSRLHDGCTGIYCSLILHIMQVECRDYTQALQAYTQVGSDLRVLSTEYTTQLQELTSSATCTFTYTFFLPYESGLGVRESEWSRCRLQLQAVLCALGQGGQLISALTD